MARSLFVCFVLSLALLCTQDGLCARGHRGEEFKILSLGGGGVRGVVSLKILEFLSQSSSSKTPSPGPINWGEQFDCFAGTSTGAIIAVGLSMGMPIDELMEAYCALSSKVFGHPSWFAIVHPKYHQDQLREALIEVLSWKFSEPEEVCLNDLPNRVIIVTVNLEDQHSHRWRMDVKHNLSKEAGESNLVDVLLQTTAAPTFFASYEHHVDGGMVANDPSLVAFARTYCPYGLDKNGALILSVGTGSFPRYISEDEKWGQAQWLSPFACDSSAGSVPLINMLCDLEEEKPSQLLAKMLPGKFRKLDVELSKDVALDDASAIPALVKRCDEVFETKKDFWHDARDWLRAHIRSS